MTPGKTRHSLSTRITELESRIEQLQLLNDLAIEAGRATATDVLLNIILERVMQELRAEQGTILTASGAPDGQLKTLIRHDERSTIRGPLRLGTELAGFVLYHKTPLLIGDIVRDGRFAVRPEERTLVRCVACVPLLHGGEVLGAIMMINRKGGGAFEPKDLVLLETIAAQVGQLLTNLRLQEHAHAARAQAMLARLEAEKEHEINELKTRLFANITHELMSPLSVILGSLDLLPGRQGEGEREEEIRVMRRNTVRLQRLLQQLLDLARLDAGQITVRVRQIDAAAFVAGVVRSFTPLAERNGVALVFRPSGDDLRGYLDCDLTEKILCNLLSNAFKWTPAGGEIVVHLERDEAQRLRVRIADTGSGIPPDQLPLVFRRYHHGDPVRSGFGIGLAFVKELADLLGGSAEIESKPGVGTTVTVVLPVERDSVPGSIRLDEPPAEGGLETAAATAHGLEAVIRPAHFQILIVEDSDDLRRYLREELQTDYTVLESADGSSGLATALEGIPDLVLCDIMMPGMDGFEVCRRLKEDERTSHVPVILLTGRTRGDDRIRGFECRADDYIAKPFDMHELKARIRNLLDGRMALRAKFAGTPQAAPASADERFLLKVREAVEARLSDPALDTAGLAAAMSLSRMQLNRKLQALTGHPTHDFVRHLRLGRAAEMLRQRSATVTEIAYAVGFNNVSHFALAFRQVYGSRPSDFMHSPPEAPAS